jgi:hypothetical protein
MPDFLGKPCAEHDPLHCACDERRDREAGIHRPSGLCDAFGGYECVCGNGSWTETYGCVSAEVSDAG